MRDTRSLSFWCAVSGCIAAAILAIPLAAQQQQQPPTFSSGPATVVPVFTTVMDADFRLVPDLEKEDFEIYDNEKVQTITLFDNQPQPISVVMMLDTSASMTASIALLKQAAEQFIIRLLPDDKAAVGAFNDKIELSAGFSNKRDALITDVNDLDYGNSTRLYDALDESLTMLEKIGGRRVVLVFTDGDDTSSRVGRGKVLDRARLSDVMVYAIGLQSEYFDGARVVRSSPDRGLRTLAEETGGGYFELKKTADLGSTFTRVAQELHSQYALAFEPRQLDGKVHKLAVKLKRPGLTARARRSYVATADTPTTK